MSDMVVHPLSIFLSLAGLYYVFRLRKSSKSRYCVCALVFISFAGANAFALAHSLTRLPVFHLLYSYPSTITPMLLIVSLLLIIQAKEKSKLQNREQNLVSLQNMGAKASGTFDINQIAEFTLSEILYILRLDGMALYLTSKDKNYLELVRSEGLFKEISPDFSIISAEEAPFLFDATEPETIDVCNLECDGGLQACNRMRAAGFESVFALHLFSKKELIGVIVLVGKDDMELTVEQTDFITNTATWLSVAISNAGLYENLRTAYLKIINSFSKAIEAKDFYTQGHSSNVAKLSTELALRLGLSDPDIERIYMGGQLHDVGKIAIPEAILNKQGALTEEEYKIVKDHPYKGFEITQPIDGLIKISDIVVYHHERYDGKGYPLGLNGEKIPLLARITAIADAFDAMTSDRPYRKAMPYSIALEIIEQNKGTQFDPALADRFIEMIKEKMEHKSGGVDISADELSTLFNGYFLSNGRATC